jgi:hypothetical protein
MGNNSFFEKLNNNTDATTIKIIKKLTVFVLLNIASKVSL